MENRGVKATLVARDCWAVEMNQIQLNPSGRQCRLNHCKRTLPQISPLLKRWDSSSASFRFFVLLLINCYAPVFLIWSGAIPFAYRFHVLAVVLLSFIVHSVHRGYRLHDLGFTLEHSWNSIRWNLMFCTIGGIGLYLAYRAGMSDAPRIQLFSYLFSLLYCDPRAGSGTHFSKYYVCRDEEMSEHWSQNDGPDFNHHLLVSPHHLQPSGVTPDHVCQRFSLGGIYLRWPSIWGISLSHSLLGALAMFLGVL